jgi:hypothetical protein
MKNPAPVHLTTDDELRASGWTWAARDADGHLLSTSTDDPERVREYMTWPDVVTIARLRPSAEKELP